MLVYSYPGYPALLWLVSGFAKRPTGTSTEGAEDNVPSLTLIISAYNEEKVIAEKIDNALALEYPKELLEIVVVSDGSSDSTTDIVSKFANKGVVLRHYEGRIGKTACLNRALPLAAGKIIVFSDANSKYDRSALKALVCPFKESTVGFVTGWTRYGSSEDMTAAYSLGLYSRLEFMTKELESTIGSCVGADGAIFAIRKELYVPLRDYDINDFVIPLTINEQGYRGVLQKRAFCYEKDAGGTKGEFHRQVRITTRTIRAIIKHRQLLNPFRFGLFSIKLFSHKVCKFLVPVFTIALFLSSLLLAPRSGFYLAALIGQLLFYGGAGAAPNVPKTGCLSRLTEAAKTFIVVNVAILIGWAKYLQGATFTTWSPTVR
ncbi:MAG: glycosyltransferase family 2 protein [Gammaproteobacteria bacterium]